MSNDADLEYGPTPPGAEYEHTDIDPGIGYRFGIWLAVSMAIGAAIVYGTYSYLEYRGNVRDEVRRFPLAQGVAEAPPAPRLQTQPHPVLAQQSRGVRVVGGNRGTDVRSQGSAQPATT